MRILRSAAVRSERSPDERQRHPGLLLIPHLAALIRATEAAGSRHREREKSIQKLLEQTTQLER
jgi:hypothetical protein